MAGALRRLLVFPRDENGCFHVTTARGPGVVGFFSYSWFSREFSSPPGCTPVFARSVVPEPLSEPGAVPGAEGGVNEHKAVFPPARALRFGGRAGFPGGAGLESHTEGKSPWRFKAMSQEELPEGKGG